MGSVTVRWWRGVPYHFPVRRHRPLRPALHHMRQFCHVGVWERGVLGARIFLFPFHIIISIIT